MLKTGMMAAALCVASGAQAQLTLNLIETVDVTTEFNGSTANGNSAASVAWNGSTLWVGGVNNSGAASSVGVVRYDNVLGTISAPTSLGTQVSDAFEGYEYLATDGSSIFASYTGTGDGDIVGFDSGNASIPFTFGETGPLEGIAYDRRFGGRVDTVRFGSGFLRRNNPDGSDASDVVVFNGSVATGWRGIDVAFDGELLVQTINGTFIYETGDGTPNSGVYNTGTVTQIGGFNSGASNGLNVSALEGIEGLGDLAVFNDRGAGSLEDALSAALFDGTLLNVIVDDGGLIGDSSTGWYDFSYDNASGTLAVSDFSNNQVYIFNVVPTPGVAAVLGSACLLTTRRRR